MIYNLVTESDCIRAKLYLEKLSKNKIDFTCEPNSDLETKRKAVQEFLGKKVQTLIKLK